MSQPRKSAPARKAKSSFPRRTALVAGAVILLGAGTWAWLQRGAGDEDGAWRTTTVERGDIRVVISATGTLSATSTIVVGSQISGQVTDVLVDFNDEVRKGQLIARIDPSSYQAQIDQGNAQIQSARAALAQAEATLRNAELDHRRKADLGGRQLVSRSDVDLARSALDQARAQVDSARAQISQQAASLQTTQVNLDRTEIRAPVDGVVLTRTIEPGQTVAASLQAPELFTIAEDLGKMQIELAVDEADIGQVAQGQAVSFTVDAFADRQFRGEVRQVRLSATDTSNVITYPVVVSVDNSDGTLLPGLTVNAEIEVSRRDDVLLASNAALRYKPSDTQAAALQTPAPRAGGGGAVEGLVRLAGSMDLSAGQREAFDSAVAAIGERADARRAAAPRQGGNSVFGGGGVRVAGAGASGNMQSQMRQRMLQRYQQDFAAFRDSLDAGQRQRWDRELAALTAARFAPVYKLVGDRPQPAMVRIGASDGSNTEISGDVSEGDVLITGERAGP